MEFIIRANRDLHLKTWSYIRIFCYTYIPLKFKATIFDTCQRMRVILIKGSEPKSISEVIAIDHRREQAEDSSRVLIRERWSKDGTKNRFRKTRMKIKKTIYSRKLIINLSHQDMRYLEEKISKKWKSRVSIEESYFFHCPRKKSIQRGYRRPKSS